MVVDNVRIGNCVRLNIPTSELLHLRVVVTDVIRDIFANEVIGIEYQVKAGGSFITMTPDKFFPEIVEDTVHA